MNTKQIEVHCYYKALYPKALIIYHLPGHFMVMGKDVEQALKLVPNIQIVDEGVGVMPDDILLLSKLGVNGDEIRVIQYRNDSGGLDMPDVRRLYEEKEADY